MSNKNKSCILVVDDELTTVIILQDILERNGFQSITADDGFKALDIIKTTPVDAVLLDIFLPEMDGYELCVKIKEYKADLPIIAVTGALEDSVLKKSFDSGAMDFIHKPVNEIEVISRLKNILRIRNSEQTISKLYNEIMKDITVAQSIQSYMIPPYIITDGDSVFSSTYSPSNKVGGDLFNIIRISPEQYVIYMGDISGHGIQAALLMTAVKAILELLLSENRMIIRPHEILTRLNYLLCQNIFESNFMTMILGVLDTKTFEFTYLNAGHPPIFLYNRTENKIIQQSNSGAIPLGWMSDFIYEEKYQNSVFLDRDIIMLLYTDGIFECKNEDDMELGLEGIKLIIEKIKQENLPVFPHVIKQELLDLKYDLSFDDFTIISFYRTVDDGNSLFFKLPAFLINVSSIAKECEKFILEKEDDPILAAKVELIVTEILNNIIIHGINSSNSYIVLTIQSSNSIRFSVYDNGKVWSLKDKMQETKATTDLRREHGRGLQIIHDLTDEVKVSRVGDINITEITINKEKPEGRK